MQVDYFRINSSFPLFFPQLESLFIYYREAVLALDNLMKRENRSHS